MTKVYIVETPYHLLISLVKTILEKRLGKDVIIIYKKNFCISTIERLRNIFKNVLCFNTVDNIVNLLNLKIRQKKIPILSRFAKQNHNIDEIWLQDKDVYIFNDGNYYGCLLNHLKKTYTIIEDGLNSFSSSLAEVDQKKRHRLYSLLGFSWECFGKSKYTSSIEVNDISKMRIKYSNAVEVNREQLFCLLKKEDVELIANVFDIKKLNIPQEQEASLLFTQPLSEDKIVSHEKKIRIYKHLVDTYAVGKLYIKVHPREKENYSTLFPNAIILGNNLVPFEVYLLTEKIRFRRAITVFSAAIDTISCADEKISMGIEWMQKFK